MKNWPIHSSLFLDELDLGSRRTAMISFVVFLSCWCSQARGQITTGTYATKPGATVLECSDDSMRIPSGICMDLVGSIQGRELPISASITLDFSGAEPAMSAVIDNAYWEGASNFGLIEPFELTLQSDLSRVVENGYAFTGVYVAEPWQFDWELALAADGILRWNGAAYWTGGHFWSIFYEDLPLVLVPEASTLTLALIGILPCICSRRQTRVIS